MTLRGAPTKDWQTARKIEILSHTQNNPMKLKTLLTLLATAAIGTSAAFAAEEDTPLAKEMKATNKALRTLKRQIADSAKKDENLKLAAECQEHTAAAAKYEPAQIKEVPEADKAAYLEKYKLQMAELAKSFEALAAAIKADKQDDAKAVLEKLSEQKEKGHKDFAPDE
jgi:Cytochrome b562